AGAHPFIEIRAKDFDDPADVPVTNAIALSVAFDSRDAADKAPFGPIVPGTEVAYSLHALPGVTRAELVIETRRLEGPQDVLEYGETARVPLLAGAAGERDGWTGRYRFDEIGVYGYYFALEIDGKTFLYQNNRDSIPWTREKGSGGIGQVEGTTDPLHRIRRF